MATDRYSDDHKIVVGGGSGTLTVEADLAVTGEISFSGDLGITGDLNVTGDINSSGDLNFSGSGTSTIASTAGVIDINGDQGVFILSSSGEVTLEPHGDLNLYAGSGTLTGAIKISPTGAVLSSVYMNFSKTDDEIVIGGPTLTIESDAIELSSEITYPVTREVHLAVPYIGFSRDSSLNSVSSVSNSTFGYLDINGSGSGGVAYLEIALPDSIPDGSEITSIGGGFNWSISSSSTASVDVNLLECLIGSSGTYSTVQTDTKTIQNDSTYYFKSFDINYTISKSKAYMISVVATLPSTHSLSFYGIRITYQTGRVDINVPI